MNTRPRTKFVMQLKSRRCPKCGAKLNNQVKLQALPRGARVSRRSEVGCVEHGARQVGALREVVNRIATVSGKSNPAIGDAPSRLRFRPYGLACPSNSSTAAPMSDRAISVSPTSMASTPAF